MKHRVLLKKGLIAGLLVLALPLMGAAPADEPAVTPPSHVVGETDAIEDYLQGLRSMEARFIQQGPDGTMAEGTMLLKRPGRLRFEYGKDIPLLLVSNGKILSFIDYDINQVTRWPIRDTPLGVLVDDEIDLSKDLNVKRINTADGLLRVEIKDPKHEDEGFITLIFNASPLELRAWEVTDSQGLKTRVTLIDPVTNVTLKNSQFEFDDPRTLPMTGGRKRH